MPPLAPSSLDSLSKRRLALLTCGVGGLQVVWSVVLSNGATFLISLGLSKTMTPLVWLAAPLCGFVVQPVIALQSDLYQSSWGRRRPFVLSGALGTIASILALSWVEEIFHIFSDCLGTCSAIPDQYSRQLTIATAVILVYCLNISVTTLQVALRTLVVEKCPQHQQVQASAWASYMTGIGNIVGYIAGSSSLPKLFGMPSISQFQWLCAWASVVLLLSTGLTCWSVKEDSSLMLASSRLEFETRTVLSSLLSTWRTMPDKAKCVCYAQFWSWMGWFPFLYYSTTYIGELYAAPIYKAAPSVNPVADSIIHAKAINIGTFGSLMFAIVSLSTNLLLQYIIESRSGNERSQSSWGFLNLSLVANLPRLWAASHVFFAILMMSTWLVDSSSLGIWVVGSAGVSWAITVWAPFAIIGSEIAELKVAETLEKTGDSESPRTKAASIMGLHNAAISAPQILAAMGSSLIFWAARAAGSASGLNWIFTFCAATSLVAAYTAKALDSK